MKNRVQGRKRPKKKKKNTKTKTKTKKKKKKREREKKSVGERGKKKMRACKGEKESGCVIKYNFFALAFLLQCTAIDGWAL